MLGFVIKLIGYTEASENGVRAIVSPRMVPATNPLCRIDDVFNGVLVEANMVGEVMFYGPGAGKLPTASAVVADIIDVIANRDASPKALEWTAATACDVLPLEAYACTRVFILNCTAAQIPAELCADKAVELDGKCAVVTAQELTEKQTAELAASMGDKLLSVYRVL